MLTQKMFIGGTVALTLSVVALAGCKTPMPAGPQAPTNGSQPAMAPAAQKVGVAPSALDGIKDATKQQAAATLSTELAVSLRAERTMRDAELLAARKPAAYALLSDREDEPSPKPRASATAQAGSPEVKAGRSPEAEHHDGQEDEHDKAERAAEDTWKRLPEAERQAIKAKVEGHEAKLRAKLQAKLAKKEKAFQRKAADQVQKDADGSQAVTSAFAVATPQGQRDVTVTRSLAPDGTVLQTREKLAGTGNGVTFSCDRSRTVNPDGSVSLVSDATITLDGQTRTIHWEKTIGADGTLSGAGTIKRADGTSLTLKASGTEEGTESVAAVDGAAGVQLTLAADAATGAANVTVNAGAAGQDTLKVDADEEDNDEGKVDDNQPDDRATATKAEKHDDQAKGHDDHDDEKSAPSVTRPSAAPSAAPASTAPASPAV